MGQVDYSYVAERMAQAEIGTAEAFYDLGLLYSIGQGVDQDFIEAHKWFNLAAIRGMRVIATPEGGPIVSFTVEGYDPADVAVLVEQIAGVQVRSGHHCAARVHEQLGTAAGGTVRASFGPFNTTADVDALVGAIETITGGA